MLYLRKELLCGVVALLAAASAAVAQGAGAKTEASRDCWSSTLRGQDDELLTREEKIALLDKALLDAVNDFDPCQTKPSSASGVSAGGGGLTGKQNPAGAQESASGGASTSGVDSLPVGDIQGDAPVTTPVNGIKNRGGARNESVFAKAPGTNAPQTSSNGKVPEDIPALNNDDIIAQQLRQAAMEEKDPQQREKLWNEYRRYKNLPVKEEPKT